MEPIKANLLIIKNSSKVFEKEVESTQNYRNRTKVIAYLNIVYFSIWVPFFLMLVVHGICFTAFYMNAEIPQGTKLFPHYSTNVNLIYIWSIILLFGIEVVCQLFASLFLLCSTEVDAYLQPALIQARLWRNITIGYTIANLLNAMIAPQLSLYDVVFQLIRVGMIYTVQKYIKQLEKQNGALVADIFYVDV